jgi:hypothetical protein
MNILSWLAVAPVGAQDSVKSKLVERVVRHISTQCHFGDSTRSSLKVFFTAYVDELATCLKDPDCRFDQVKREEIHFTMLAGLRKEFGRSAMKAYLKLSLRPPRNRKMIRLRTSRYSKQPGGYRLRRMDIQLDL